MSFQFSPQVYTFLDYAQDYLEANAELIEPSREYLQFKEMLEKERPEKPVQAKEEAVAPVDAYTEVVSIHPDTLTAPETVPSPAAAYDAERHTRYQKLLTDALYDCYLGDTTAARKKLATALELEACGCFPRDGRVQLVYDQLSKKGKKQKKQK